MKLLVSIADSDAAVKLIFDNVRNLALCGVVAALANWEFTHAGVGWSLYFHRVLGVIFALLAGLLFAINLTHARFKLREAMAPTWTWVAVDTFYGLITFHAAWILVFAKISAV